MVAKVRFLTILSICLLCIGRKDDILRIIAKEVGHTGRQEDALQCFTECIASFTTVDNRSMWKNLFSFVVAKEWNAVSAGVIQIEEQHVEDFSKQYETYVINGNLL